MIAAELVLQWLVQVGMAIVIDQLPVRSALGHPTRATAYYHEALSQLDVRYFDIPQKP